MTMSLHSARYSYSGHDNVNSDPTCEPRQPPSFLKGRDMNSFNRPAEEKPIQCIQSGDLTMAPKLNFICSEPYNWGELQIRVDLTFEKGVFHLYICNTDGKVISDWEMSMDNILGMFEDAKDYNLSQSELELTGMLYPKQDFEKPDSGTNGLVGWPSD